MKRITKTLAMVLTVVIFGIMVLGSGSDSSTETKAVVAEEKNEAKADAGTEASMEATAEATTEAPAEAPAPAISIEEQVLFEADGVTATAKEWITDSIWGDGIKILLENNGNKDVGISCNEVIVNDYMISSLFSETIAAGKKSNCTLNLSRTELKAAGIDTVGKIEVYFHTFDTSTYMTLTNIDCVTIKTSAFDSMEIKKMDDGQELYNENGIRIVGKTVDENSFWGAGILLFIENTSDKNVCVQAEDLSVNGYMMTPLFSSTVFSGKMALSEITLLSNELEENGIKSIDEVELKFHIFDADTYNTIKDTDVISFSAK